MMKDIKFFYPSFVRKAVTFTIDDGNFKFDEMFLDILKPAGIRGTFNLCSNSHTGREEYTREFYEGYGIANHCKYHPFVNFDGAELKISNEEFDESTADKSFIYPVKGKEGFFWQIHSNGWRQMVFEDDYCRLVFDGQSELRAIFGEGSVRDYVWPFREQDNAKVKDFIRRTHRSARKTGCTFDRDGFAIPKDKYAWSYNADDRHLLEVMEKYEAYADDGELKFFAFGVHSKDFETNSTWDDLRAFAEKYGNRPDKYWYATVEEIFDYEEAVNAFEITDDGALVNHSNIDIYAEIDGERYVIKGKMNCNDVA